MTFQEALTLCISGTAIRRKGWDSGRSIRFFVPPQKGLGPYFQELRSDDSVGVMGSFPSLDILSGDWEALPAKGAEEAPEANEETPEAPESKSNPHPDAVSETGISTDDTVKEGQIEPVDATEAQAQELAGETAGVDTVEEQD